MRQLFFICLRKVYKTDDHRNGTEQKKHRTEKTDEKRVMDHDNPPATIGTAATSTWICAGLLIQKFYMKHYRVINIILALTLLECIWSMLKA